MTETAQHPFEWFKYYLPGHCPDDIELPPGAQLLISVNDRLANISYCYDAKSPMKSGAIKNSPFYDNSLTNFIVNKFQYGAGAKSTLVEGHFVLHADYTLWFYACHEQGPTRIQTWEEAVALGFSTQKLARLALYFIYPSLALNRAMFARFLMETTDIDDLPNPMVAEIAGKAASVESIIKPLDRSTAPIPFELFGLAGPPVRIEYDGYDKMLKHVSGSSVTAFLQEFNYITGASGAVEECWKIVMNFFTFWLKKFSDEEIFVRRSAFSTLCFAIVAYVNARTFSAVTSLPSDSVFALSESGDKLGSQINRFLHIFPSIYRDLVTRSRFDIMVEKVLSNWEFSFSKAYIDTHVVNQQTAYCTEIIICMQIFKSNVGAFAEMIPRPEYRKIKDYFQSFFGNIIKRATATKASGTALDDCLSNETIKAVKPLTRILPGSNPFCLIPQEILTIVEHCSDKDSLCVLFDALGTLRYYDFMIQNHYIRDKRLKNNASRADIKTEAAAIASKLMDNISFLRDAMRLKERTKLCEASKLLWKDLLDKSAYDMAIFKTLHTRVLYETDVDTDDRQLTATSWDRINTLISMLGSQRVSVLEEYNDLVRKAQDAGINPLASGSVLSLAKQQHSTRKREMIVLGANYERGSRVKFSHVYCLSSTHKEYKHGAALTNALISAPDKYLEAITDLELFKTLVMTTKLNDKSRKESQHLFLTFAPPWVSDPTDPSSLSYRIPNDKYVKLIREVFQRCNTPADDTDASVKKAIIGVANPIANFWKDIIGDISAVFDTQVVFTTTNVNKVVSNQHKDFRTAFKQFMNNFFATLLWALKTEDFKAIFPSLNWKISAAKPVVKKIEDIKTTVSVPSKDDIITILDYKYSGKESVRIDSRLLINTKIEQIKTLDLTKILLATDRSTYEDQCVLAVKGFVDRFYTNLLTGASVSGISTSIALIKGVCKTSALIHILEYLHEKAKKLPLPCSIDERFSSDSESDCEVADDVYRTDILEPPTLTCQKGNTFKFNPPVYNVRTGDWLNFIEKKYMGWCRQRGLSAYDKAVGLFYVLKGTRLQNKFLRTFGEVLNQTTLNSPDKFQDLYVKVGSKFWPEQRKCAADYIADLNNPAITKQNPEDTLEEHYHRLKELFLRAYPNDGINSSTNKLRFCEIFYFSLHDSYYKRLIQQDHYEDIFTKGRLKKVLKCLQAKEKQRLDMQKRNKMNAKFVGRIETSPKVDSSNVTVEKVEQEPRLKTNPKNGNRHKLAMRQASNMADQNGSQRLKKSVNYVPNSGQRNYYERNNTQNYENRQNQMNGSNSRGRQYQKPRYIQQNYQSDKRFQNYTTNRQNDRSLYSVGFGSPPPNLDNYDKNNYRQNELDKEIQRLKHNRNRLPNGTFRTPLNKVPEHIRERKDFVLADYCTPSVYRSILDMAKDNLRQRRQQAAQKGANTRKNRRKTMNSWAKRMVSVPNRGSLRITKNNDSDRVFMVNTGGSDPSTSNPTLDCSYLLHVTFGQGNDTIKIPTVWDTGSGANLISDSLFKRLEAFGEFDDSYQPVGITGAFKGGEINVIGKFTVDIVIGERTLYKDLELLVCDNVPENLCLIGTEVISDITDALGVFVGPIFHHPDCRNRGNKTILKDCFESCASLQHGMVLNPFSTEFEVIKFIPDHSSTTSVDPDADDKFLDQEYAKILEPVKNSIPIRFTADETCHLSPGDSKALKIRPEIEVFDKNTGTTEWKALPNHMATKIVLASLNTEMAQKMGCDETVQKLYIPAKRCFKIEHNGENKIDIQPGQKIANVYLTQPGKNIKRMDDKIHKDYLQEF